MHIYFPLGKKPKRIHQRHLCLTEGLRFQGKRQEKDLPQKKKWREKKTSRYKLVPEEKRARLLDAQWQDVEHQNEDSPTTRAARQLVKARSFKPLPARRGQAPGPGEGCRSPASRRHRPRSAPQASLPPARPGPALLPPPPPLPRKPRRRPPALSAATDASPGGALPRHRTRWAGSGGGTAGGAATPARRGRHTRPAASGRPRSRRRARRGRARAAPPGPPNAAHTRQAPRAEGYWRRCAPRAPACRARWPAGTGSTATTSASRPSPAPWRAPRSPPTPRQRPLRRAQAERRRRGGGSRPRPALPTGRAGPGPGRPRPAAGRALPREMAALRPADSRRRTRGARRRRTPAGRSRRSLQKVETQRGEPACGRAE